MERIYEEEKNKAEEKSKKPESKQSSKGSLHVTTGEVSSRDGAYYILHTLVGARNAGLISLTTDIQVGAEGSGVVITSLTSGKGAVKRGTVGRGGVKKDLKQAEMLSVSDPQKLMGNLLINNAVPSKETNDIKKVLLILRQAIYNTGVMSKAFVGVKEIK